MWPRWWQGWLRVAGRDRGRAVHTWSQLASAFNTKPSKGLGRHFARESAGLFCLPELREPEGFYLLKENAVLRAQELMEECCSPHRKRKMVEVFDELSDSLCRVADLAEFVRMAHPQPRYCHAAEDACIAIGGLVEKLNTHRQLYDGLEAVVAGGDKFSLTDVDKHVAKLFLFDFEQSGIHLDKGRRSRVVALNEAILSIGQHFLHGSQHPRAVPKTSLPEHLRHHFALEGECVVVRGLHSDAHTETTREAAYKIFLYPDPHQETLLTQLLHSRHQMATLCGFPSYSHRAQCGSLAESPHLVQDFLQLLSQELRPRADQDFKQMSAMKKAQAASARMLAPWDVPYLTAEARQGVLGMNGKELAPYLSLGAVMQGLSDLLHHLYGLTLELWQAEPGELWSPDVYKVAVKHSSEGLLGFIYCDFYERVGKSHQDCHFTIRGGKLLPDGSYQDPVVVLHLNLPSPSWSCPSLLSPGMVENLFHEMGHALHSMLARTQYQHVTGTRCSTDFAEVPSILMEYFALDPRVLCSFARHYKTGERIPKELVERLVASKSVFAASEMQLQTFYSALDQRLHGEVRWDPETSTTHILQEVHTSYYGLPYVKNTAWQLRFGHLVGYGAKYYSYLLARAVASWIWHQYFAQDPFSRSMGEKYREEVLSHGGGKPARTLVGGFLGRGVDAPALVEALLADLDHRRSTTAP